MKRLLLSAILFCLACRVLAQLPHINTTGGVALGGFDAVSYFTVDGPVSGSADHIVKYMGVTYQFASESNRAEFARQPENYVPAYGGWCAYAMGVNGERVEVDPATYKISDGRLFLFYNRFMNNTLKKWNAREEVLLPRADRNWNSQLKTSQSER